MAEPVKEMYLLNSENRRAIRSVFIHESQEYSCTLRILSIHVPMNIASAEAGLHVTQARLLIEGCGDTGINKKFRICSEWISVR